MRTNWMRLAGAGALALLLGAAGTWALTGSSEPEVHLDTVTAAPSPSPATDAAAPTADDATTSTTSALDPASSTTTTTTTRRATPPPTTATTASTTTTTTAPQGPTTTRPPTVFTRTPPKLTGDYAVSCSPSSLATTPGGSVKTTCRVDSSGGFAGAVWLRCLDDPGAPPACQFDPVQVNVAPGSPGSAEVMITVSSAASGQSDQKKLIFADYKGSPYTTRNTEVAVAVANFSVVCGGFGDPSAPVAGSMSQKCRLTSYSGFSQPVTLLCTGQPAGASCEFSPPAPTPPSSGSVDFQLLVRYPGVAPGTYTFDGVAESAGLRHTFSVSLQVP